MADTTSLSFIRWLEGHRASGRVLVPESQLREAFEAGALYGAERGAQVVLAAPRADAREIWITPLPLTEERIEGGPSWSMTIPPGWRICQVVPGQAFGGQWVAEGHVLCVLEKDGPE